jgi:predicted dehydrogenase
MIDRRTFMAVAGGAAGGRILNLESSSQDSRSDPLVVAVVGIHGQGKSHLQCFAAVPGVRIKTICDVDERTWPEAARFAERCGVAKVGFEADFRRVLDDREIDAVSIATPNHQHALQTIWACQAGKDVYVEKPVSHDLGEGRQAVKAARRYGRVVVGGMQQRSYPHVIEAVERLRSGVIGDVYLARGLCFKPRPSIGRKGAFPVPPGLDFDLWLGPAPERPFTENLVHYNWHWFWDFGNGDIGNQGVHEMDAARWGLGQTTLPTRVHSTGGYYGEPCDQETPNTQTATFEWPDGKVLQFEVRGLATHDEHGIRIGNLFYGTEGWMHLDIQGFRTFLGPKGEPGPSMDAVVIGGTASVGGPAGFIEGEAHESSRFMHREHFVKAVRSRKPADVRGDILEGHLSSALCHLANVSYRLKRSLVFDPETETFPGDAEASALLSRPGRAPFAIPRDL